MTSCEHVLSLSAPFVDGELTDAQRATVEAHLSVCRACRQAVDAEREGLEALLACRDSLRERAPAHLRIAVERLSRHPAPAGAGSRRTPRPRVLGQMWPGTPIAATLALAGMGILAYGLLSQGGTALAAQLALDHLKCVRIVAGQAPRGDVETVATHWEREHGWHVSLPTPATDSGFEFVALRRCLHARGFLAHALYRHGDHLVSLFEFPQDVQAAGVLEIMGERASFWSHGSHTYAVVGAQSVAELNDFVSFVRRVAD